MCMIREHWPRFFRRQKRSWQLSNTPTHIFVSPHRLLSSSPETHLYCQLRPCQVAQNGMYNIIVDFVCPLNNFPVSRERNIPVSPGMLNTSILVLMFLVPSRPLHRYMITLLLLITSTCIVLVKLSNDIAVPMMCTTKSDRGRNMSDSSHVHCPKTTAIAGPGSIVIACSESPPLHISTHELPARGSERHQRAVPVLQGYQPLHAHRRHRCHRHTQGDR